MRLEDLRPWLFWALTIDFVGFAAFTGYVLIEYGMGWIEVAVSNPVSTLIMVDLFIALSMVLTWLYADARARGVNPWPYIVLTLGTGSVGTLLYLVVRERPGAPEWTPEGRGLALTGEAR